MGSTKYLQVLVLQNFVLRDRIILSTSIRFQQTTVVQLKTGFVVSPCKCAVYEIPANSTILNMQAFENRKIIINSSKRRIQPLLCEDFVLMIAITPFLLCSNHHACVCKLNTS